MGFLALSTHCNSSPPIATLPAEALGERQDEFSASGIDRLIPIRFVMLLNTGESTPSDYASSVNKAVTRANLIFKPAGVQFYASAMESYITPTLYAKAVDLTNNVNWSSVWSEFSSIFPAASSSSFTGTQKVPEWFQLATERWGSVNEILIYVTPSGLGATTSFPFNGRDMEMSRDMLNNSPELAHELGHFLGIGHPFVIADTTVVNPETGNNMALADWWDLTYIDNTAGGASGTGGAYGFPQDRAQAATAASQGKLRRINNNFDNVVLTGPDYCQIVRGYAAVGAGTYSYRSNCCPDVSETSYNTGYSSGRAECSIGPGSYGGSNSTRQLITADTYGMRGLNFKTSEADNVPTSRQYGFNVMDYMQGARDFPSQFSQSQIKMLRNYLRFEVPITNSLFTNKSSRRTFLGQPTPRAPAYMLDFDGDGLRDIALWKPPTSTTSTATLTVFPSTNGTFNSASVFSISVGFSQAGDIPVPADYDGDGQTDFAVYRPGSSSSWIYCLTNDTPSATNCSSPTTISFGTREHIPVLDTDFVSGPELAIYKPSNGEWKWRSVASSTTTTRTLGGPTAKILPGLYDSDNITDLVVYDPTNAKFSMLISTDSWTNQIDHQFPSSYVASLTGGTAAQRSGAVPIAGMYKYRRLYLYANGSSVWANRLSLTLWDPASAEWASLWDPIADDDTKIVTCQWGGDSNLPIPTLGTKVNVPNTFVPTGTTPQEQFSLLSSMWPTAQGNSYLYRRNGGATCGSSLTDLNFGAVPYDRHVFVVSDMDNDDLPEIFIYTNDKQKIVRYSSATNYSTATVHDLGGNRGYLL